jgi:hypothetical protein
MEHIDQMKKTPDKLRAIDLVEMAKERLNIIKNFLKRRYLF